jgi:hypothetical protein
VKTAGLFVCLSGSGAGLYLRSPGRLLISGSSFINCSSMERGGAIRIAELVASGTGQHAHGRAEVMRFDSWLTADSRFGCVCIVCSLNRATQLFLPGILTITSSRFESNSVMNIGSGGGSILLDGLSASVLIRDCEFVDSIAPDATGGAIDSTTRTKENRITVLTIESSSFTRCFVNGGGECRDHRVVSAL